MSASYSVLVTKEELIFSAAHFITFNGNICERLHGHNYRVSCEVYGELDENQYVVDFIALRDALKETTTKLDHHVLLPTSHNMISVEPDEKEVLVRFEERRWIFPLEDCVLLPVSNTTAERLAKFIADQLVATMESKGKPLPGRIRVGVDENEGQWAYCEIAVGAKR